MGRHKPLGTGPRGCTLPLTLQRETIHGSVLGIAVMSSLVILFNRLLWRPLYTYGERHLRLD